MITEYLKEPILCAVSGGSDSMYMLCCLKEMGYDVMAAHFNHCLRGKESDADEEFVRSYCMENGIPFFAGRGDVKSYAIEKTIGTEEAARELRYSFLDKTAEKINAGCIATAHTADDNAETLLFHLARGTGLKGLCGIPEIRGKIVRPILDTSKEDASRWLLERNISHVEDSSNAADEYTRNKIRHLIIPVLENVNPAVILNINRTIFLLNKDEEYLSSLAKEHLIQHGKDAKALASLPEPIATRVIRQMTEKNLNTVHIQSILQVASKGGSTDIPGMRVKRDNGKLVFGYVEPKALPEYIIREGTTILEECHMQLQCMRTKKKTDVHAPFTTFCFPRDKIMGTLSVSARRDGDRFRPAGRGCTKTLKQLFMEKKIPESIRNEIPVVRDEKGILAVYGFSQDERVMEKSDNSDYIIIEFVKLEDIS